jgi:DNA polymerase-3 subunit delta
MSPAQFLARMKKKQLAPAFLFLGSEGYYRKQCREALLDASVGTENRDNSVTRHDLGETSLVEVIDDARALSLFATDRAILVGSAEAVLPRRIDSDDAGDGGTANSEVLSEYLRNPSPSVVLLFEATRFEFEGEDKKKLDRVRKFYAAISEVVELRRPSAEDARIEVQALAKKSGIRLQPDAVALLVDALGADLSRIATEVEKLSLYAGNANRPIGAEDVAALAPEARSTTIFSLVDALGRRNRSRSLEALDTLVREGEYLPLALSFLAGQFRMALVAREANLRTPQQIIGYFTRSGVPMWPARAEQVHQTLTRFSEEQLKKAMALVFGADRDLRDARPDDRIVMERFVVDLTA